MTATADAASGHESTRSWKKTEPQRKEMMTIIEDHVACAVPSPA